MINFFRQWCENIIVAISISLIIEMILPNGKNRKYVETIIGIYIIFTILNPIFTNMNNEINLENILKIDKSLETSANYKTNNIEEVYLEAIKNDIKIKIEELGIEVWNIEIKIDSNYKEIEEIIIDINKNKKEENNIIINEIKIEIGSQKEIENIDEEKIKNKIIEIYEIEENKIKII